MKVIFYSVKKDEAPFFQAEIASHYTSTFLEESLNEETCQYAQGYEIVCCFVTDQLNASILEQLHKQGTRLIALRSTGYDHVALKKAKELGLAIVHVPAYSPEAIAEFATGLLLALARKIIQAHDKIRAHNFSLEGQIGFNLFNKTVGIIGTGKIGTAFARIMKGFGCNLIAYDPTPNPECMALGVSYCSLEDLFRQADIISLHCLLNEQTRHMINLQAFSLMKNNAILINTGRGALVDTIALIQALKEKKIAAVGLDVYENEAPLFFKDHSNDIIFDDQFIRLQAFPNILITGHQAYLSKEALSSIAKTTLENINAFIKEISLNRLV